MCTNAPFDGREFHNLDGVPAGRSLRDVLRWKFLGGKVAPWPEHPSPNAAAPTLPDRLQPGTFAATFVGHSTFLLQFPGDLNILTDPIWSQRASPFSFAGPRRVRPPALDWKALPPIALVLVSHGHYDHLDVPTLRQLERRFSPLFLAGLGQRAFLRARGLGRVEELDWWQSRTVRDRQGGTLEITFTPAQHWSARNILQRNRTLWGGFWLQDGAGGKRVFFAADSGLGRHFGTIRERLGSPDVAFLPIGAYEPRWFMREQHMNPDDAVQAHLALGARQSVGMHFGTFRLTDEGIDQPAKDLAFGLAARNIAPPDFIVPRFGQTIQWQ
jgi:L-ascorbate metabolism protein UlaG (beta-lactamase superfamily)